MEEALCRVEFCLVFLVQYMCQMLYHLSSSGHLSPLTVVVYAISTENPTVRPFETTRVEATNAKLNEGDTGGILFWH